MKSKAAKKSEFKEREETGNKLPCIQMTFNEVSASKGIKTEVIFEGVQEIQQHKQKSHMTAKS